MATKNCRIYLTSKLPAQRPFFMETNTQHNLVEDNILIISKQTMDLLLKQVDPGRCIALYTFYYYTAKWQKTNQIKASVEYVSRGLHWDKDTVRKFKKILIGLNLVEDARRINPVTKKVTGWYIKMNYIWKAKSHPPELPGGGKSQRVGNSPTNALSANNINALSANNKGGKKIYPSLKSIGEEELEELVQSYSVTRAFVNMELRKVELHCQSSGRNYTDYRALLERFVMEDAIKHRKEVTKENGRSKIRVITPDPEWVSPR